jgi:hypothetical protein
MFNLKTIINNNKEYDIIKSIINLVIDRLHLNYSSVVLIDDYAFSIFSGDLYETKEINFGVNNEIYFQHNIFIESIISSLTKEFIEDFTYLNNNIKITPSIITIKLSEYTINIKHVNNINEYNSVKSENEDLKINIFSPFSVISHYLYEMDQKIYNLNTLFSNTHIEFLEEIADIRLEEILNIFQSEEIQNLKQIEKEKAIKEYSNSVKKLEYFIKYLNYKIKTI